MHKGDEMGYFALCGSTIVLMIPQNTVALVPELESVMQSGQEFRVVQGQWIAEKK